MTVREVMTSDPACCQPETNLQEVARMMEENDCGCIPVVRDERSRELVGVVTDRDIAMRAVAQGKNPVEMTAEQVMSSPVATATPEESVEDCCATMEKQQVRRVPVVDASGGCCGMVAQADIARRSGEAEAGEVVREVSRPAARPSNVDG
jgi:CBS domain-containing protein